MYESKPSDMSPSSSTTTYEIANQHISEKYDTQYINSHLKLTVSNVDTQFQPLEKASQNGN